MLTAKQLKHVALVVKEIRKMAEPDHLSPKEGYKQMCVFSFNKNGQTHQPQSSIRIHRLITMN